MSARTTISFLGPRGGSKGKPLTKGMQNILTAMKDSKVRRLIIVSTVSARDPNDSSHLKTKILVGVVKSTMRAAYDDIVGVAEKVRQSDCDWTIFRVSMLNDKPFSGEVKVGFVGTAGMGSQISRADLADFVLKQIQDPTYVRKAPVVSN